MNTPCISKLAHTRSDIEMQGALLFSRSAAGSGKLVIVGNRLALICVPHVFRQVAVRMCTIACRTVSRRVAVSSKQQIQSRYGAERGFFHKTAPLLRKRHKERVRKEAFFTKPHRFKETECKWQPAASVFRRCDLRRFPVMAHEDTSVPKGERHRMCRSGITGHGCPLMPTRIV